MPTPGSVDLIGSQATKWRSLDRIEPLEIGSTLLKFGRAINISSERVSCDILNDISERLTSSPLGARKVLTLCLLQCNLTDEHVDGMTALFNCLPSLTVVNICSNDFSPAAVSQLIDQRPPNLQTLKTDHTVYRFSARVSPVILDPMPLEDVRASLRHILIAGAGIAGLSLAIALRIKGFKVLVFDKDGGVGHQREGYALTIQHAGHLALARLGVDVTHMEHWSDSHWVSDAKGSPVAFWTSIDEVWNEKKRLRANAHITRRNLRLALAEAAGDLVQWDHEVVRAESRGNHVELFTRHDGGEVTTEGSILIDASGIWSPLRIAQAPKPELRFLPANVIYGIADEPEIMCRRILQSCDGRTRVFMMPFDGQGKTFWQLSRFQEEPTKDRIFGENAKALALEWLSDFAEDHVAKQIIRSCDGSDILCTPVLDRGNDFLSATSVHPMLPVSAFIGDASHPMSPFKGQGANQALIDGWNCAEFFNDGLVRAATDRIEDAEGLTGYIRSSLVRAIQECKARVSPKIKGSRDTIQSLHTPCYSSTDYHIERKCLSVTTKEAITCLHDQQFRFTYNADPALLEVTRSLKP